MANSDVIIYTIKEMYRNVTIMSTVCLMSLMIACLAAWVSFQDSGESEEELPQILAPIIGIVCAMLFFILAPWVVQLSLVVVAVIGAKIYLRTPYNIR